MVAAQVVDILPSGLTDLARYSSVVALGLQLITSMTSKRPSEQSVTIHNYSKEPAHPYQLSLVIYVEVL